jgi:hypothetical protein
VDKYWNAAGRPLQLARSSRLAESLPVKALELGGGLGWFVLLIGFGIAVFEAAAGECTTGARSCWRTLSSFQAVPLAVQNSGASGVVG